MRNKRLLLLTLSLFIAIQVLHAAETVSAQADQETIQLTSSSLWEGSPVWSPDGTRILYNVSRDAPFDTDIWVMNADGTGKRQLTTSSKIETYPSWSPDGTKIVYASDEWGNRDIWVMNADGTDKRQLTTSSKIETYPSWSPDGTKIIYESYPSIWIMNADGTGKQQLTTDGSSCSISRNGKIAYQRHMGNYDYDIWVMELDGSNKRQLTTGPEQETDPVISPDGSKVVFMVNGGEIWVVDSDGSNKKKLSTGWMRVREASWSPDGVNIAYIDGGPDGGPWDVYVINADGTRKTRLTTGPTHELAPMWSPDGTRIAYLSAKSTAVVGEANIWVMTLDSKALAGTNVPVPTIATPTSLSVSSTGGHVGDEVTVSGTGFKAGGTAIIKYDANTVATATVNTDGTFSAYFVAPASSAGQHIIIATDGTNTKQLTFNMESTPPQTPQLLNPEMNVKVKAEAYFDWGGVNDPSGVTYTLQIATDEDFSEDSIVLEKRGLTQSEYTITKDEALESVSKEAPYYWHVKAVDGASNESQWSDIREFSVAAPFSIPGWVIYVFCFVLVVSLISFLYLSHRHRQSNQLEMKKAEIIDMIDKALEQKR